MNNLSLENSPSEDGRVHLRPESNANKNIKWYSTYIALSGAYFWIAIFFLYFESKLSISDVLKIEAIYYFSVFFLEVPTGYFSDKFGKVRSLRISAILFLVSYCLFFSAQGFWSFALAQTFLAGGIAFQSGTETAFHFASLCEAGEEKSYSERESKVGAIVSFATGIAALTGGLIGVVELRWAYGLSIVGAIGGVGITFLIFREPVVESKTEIRIRTQLSEIASALQKPTLRFLFFAAFSMTILVHVPYEYFQTFIDRYLNSTQINKLTYVNSSWVNGLHAATAMIISSIFAAYSNRIKERVGVRTSVLISLSVVTLIIFLMSAFSSWWVVLIVLFRNAPHSFLNPILNAEIIPRLAPHLRATYLSVQSMAGRCGFAILLLSLSYVDAENVDLMLRLSAVFGALLILLTTILAALIKRTEH